MTEEVIDPGVLEQTKNQIRKLVAEIADLAESDIQPNEFYVEFLNRSVAAVAATGGAFWMMDGRGGLRLQYQVEFGVTGMMDGRVKTAPHDALLGCMLQATQAQIIPPSAVIEGSPQAFNPTEFALIIAPLMVDKQVVGLLEILMDPTRRGAAEEHVAVRERSLRPGGDLSQESPDAADDVAATAVEPARGVHAPDSRLARPEGDLLRGGQRRQAAGRLRPADRGAQDRRQDDGRGGQRPGSSRAAPPTWCAS